MALARTMSPTPSPNGQKSIAQRVNSIAWEQVSQHLDAQGSAMIKNLLPDGRLSASCCGRQSLEQGDGY